MAYYYTNQTVNKYCTNHNVVGLPYFKECNAGPAVNFLWGGGFLPGIYFPITGPFSSDFSWVMAYFTYLSSKSIATICNKNPLTLKHVSSGGGGAKNTYKNNNSLNTKMYIVKSKQSVSENSVKRIDFDFVYSLLRGTFLYSVRYKK